MTVEEQPSGGTSWPWHRKLGTAVILVAAFVAGWMGLFGSAYPAEDVEAPVVIVSEDGSARLFVTENICHGDDDSGELWTSRVAVYDLATGERSARTVIEWLGGDPARLTVLGVAPGGVWTHEHVNGLALRDAHDGRLLRSASELLTAEQLSRVLRSGGLDGRLAYLADEQAAAVRLSDGTWLRVSADASEAAPLTTRPPALHTLQRPGRLTVVDRGDGQLVRLDHRRADPESSARLSDGGALFLRPWLLASHDDALIVIDEPDSVFVVHDRTLEEDSPVDLSRVLLDSGTPVWTVELGPRVQIMLAHATENAIALVMDVDELAAFSLSDGRKLYDVELEW